MTKLLLHTCCAPCTTYVYNWLSFNFFEVRGFFYNPNIQPDGEYVKRAITMDIYEDQAGISVIYELDDVETEPGNCEDCYRIRLRKTAETARKEGFDSFTTTLLISPYQKHDLLKQVGEEIGSETGVEFFYHDFRPGYRKSRQMARGMKLYMQKYCGCTPKKTSNIKISTSK